MSEPVGTVGIDVNAVRHSTEGSRFALALVASAIAVSVGLFVLIASGQSRQILVIVGIVALTILVIWLLLQLLRIRLVADAVKVSAASLPEVQAAVDHIRERLDYYRRVDIFVVDKVSRVLEPKSPPVVLTSLFGLHVIVVEGSALGDLSNRDQDRERIFLLATCFGALKARHTRWSPALLALMLCGLPRLVFIFIRPWHRATVYTGDRIAFACAADLDISLRAVYRVLVGGDVAPYLRSEGLVGQSLTVRRSIILRLAQMLRSEPHVSNRYLELLAFAQEWEASGYERFRANLGPHSGGIDQVIARLRHRRPTGVALPVGLAISVAAMALAIGAGLRLAAAPPGAVGYPVAFLAGPPTAPPPTVPPSTAPRTPTSPPPSLTPAEALTALLPLDMVDCVEMSPASELSANLVVAVTCGTASPTGPLEVSYYAYADQGALDTAVDAWLGDLPFGDCAGGVPGRDRWTHAGIERGDLACYVTQADESALLWAEDSAATLAIAESPGLGPDELYGWWTKQSPLHP